MRLFVAVDLPEGVRDELAKICRGLPGAKWTRRDQIHLTLRFIGEAKQEELSRIRDALAGVNCEAFSLRLRGVGRFPPRGAPRIVWAGIEPGEPAHRLHARVEDALREAGVAPEARPFSPHLTLARLHETRFTAAEQFLAREQSFRTESFTVSEFFLYSSVLAPAGAAHSKEATYALKKSLPVSCPGNG